MGGTGKWGSGVLTKRLPLAALFLLTMSRQPSKHFRSAKGCEEWKLEMSRQFKSCRAEMTFARSENSMDLCFGLIFSMGRGCS
jgi:hypothetical protein